MTEVGFSEAELLETEDLLRELGRLQRELGRRAELNVDLLERLAKAVNRRVFDVFLFLWKYGPATWKQMVQFFPDATLRRALYQLEAFEVVVQRDSRYMVRR